MLSGRLLGSDGYPLRDVAVTIQGGGVGPLAVTKPNREVGDLLFLSRVGTDTNKTGWTRVSNTNAAYYWRIATNDANDDLTLGTPASNYGTIAVYAAFRPVATTHLQTGIYRQRIGANEFVTADLIEDVGKTNTLAIYASQRTGISATQSPVYSRSPSWVTLAAEEFQDWSLVTPFTSTRFHYAAIGYRLEPTADARAESDFVYSPWEGSAFSIASDARSFRFEP